MALKEAQPEPSMEEILASIRRIISEEETEATEPVLDLTQAAPDDDLMVFDEEPAVAVAEPAPMEPAPRAAAPAPAPRPAPPAAAPSPAATVEAIISAPAANAAAGALTRLAGSLRVSDHEGQTLEGMVRELLKPMLKEWLDHNLPAIVESRVEAELERIARLAR